MTNDQEHQRDQRSRLYKTWTTKQQQLLD